MALLIRAPGLGKWPLMVDEFYFSKSVSYILEKGIPEFPGGGYYTRGIGLQYLSTIPATIFDNREFAMRLVPLIFGVLSIPLFFLLARIFLPLFPALLCTTILLLSSWHVEFSRFARMYAPFQFVFLAFVYSFYNGYWQNMRKHQLISWILAFLSIFIYEGSIFLPFILSLALVHEDSHKGGKYVELITVVTALLILNFLVLKIDFRNLGITAALPPEMVSMKRKFPLKLPIVHLRLDLLFSVWRSIFATICFLILIGYGIFGFIKKKVKGNGFWMSGVFLIALTLPLFHLFGLLIGVLIVLFLLRSDVQKMFYDSRRFWVTYLFAAITVWSVFGYLLGPLWLPGGSEKILFSRLFSLLFLYPPIHYAIVYPFASNIPIWSIFVLILILSSIIHNIFINRNISSIYILIIIVLCSLMISIVRKPYNATRYFYFFFPLIILLTFLEILALIRWIEKYRFSKGAIFYRSLILIPMALFFMTEDFNLHHLLNVSSKETSMRLGKYRNLAELWYPRADFKSPASYVNGVYKDGDIVVLDYVNSSFYVTTPFVNFVSIDHDRFESISRMEGKEEIWTGRPLVYNIKDLVNLVPDKRGASLWLIAILRNFGGGSFQGENDPVHVAEKYNLHASLRYVGIDGRIGVWRIRRVGGNNTFTSGG